MGELVRKCDGLYKKYERLLLKKEQLMKEAASIETAYLKKFGELMVENFEAKLDIIYMKKKIAYVQAARNRGKRIDIKEMEDELDRLMKCYRDELRDLIREKNAAKKAIVDSPWKCERAKKAYRRLAKILHPDLNPVTAENDELRDLWERVTAAYMANSYEELEELEVIVRKTLSLHGVSTKRPQIDNIEKRIATLEEEIMTIVSTEPYTYSKILRDRIKCLRKMEELMEEHHKLHVYYMELIEILDQIIEGGEPFTWEQV